MSHVFHFQRVPTGFLYIVSRGDGTVIQGYARTLTQARHAVRVELAAL